MVKESNRLQKIRIIVKEHSRVTLGVTIPSCFSHWKDTYVTISEENGRLILSSGAIPQPLSNKQIKQHSVEVSKLKI